MAAKVLRFPTAPVEMSAGSKALWKVIVQQFEMSPADLEVLRSAMAARDRAIEAAAIIARDGLTTVDRYGGIRAHPAVDIELRNQSLFARLVRQMGIDQVAMPANRRGRPSIGNR